MGTDKRARQKANRQARLERALVEQQHVQKKHKLYRYASIAGGVAVAFVIVGGLLKLSSSSSSTTTTTSTTAAVTSTTTAGVTLVAPALGKTISGDTPCPKTDGTEERATKFEKVPPMCIDPAKTYTARVTTSIGQLSFALDAKAAPKTVNNFVVLSRYKFYEGVPFHRIVPGFVAQIGDAAPPTAPDGAPQFGAGGPGYKFDDEVPADVSAYKPGTLAMANSGPNTNGSQFFLVSGQSGVRLPPQYSLFGKIVKGLEVLEAMQKVATDRNDRPQEQVVIQSVTITES